MSFAERFDKLLRDMDVSNYRMSKETGISDSLIGYWRQGKRKPALDNIVAISDYLGVSVSYLINGKDDTSTPSESMCLSATEVEIINIYRLLPTHEQKEILTYTKYRLTEHEKTSSSDSPPSASETA